MPVDAQQQHVGQQGMSAIFWLAFILVKVPQNMAFCNGKRIGTAGGFAACGSISGQRRDCTANDQVLSMNVCAGERKTEIPR
jgi:hypothetical protein